ncbi:OLC1v1007677C1 [Oldenlandia corymbosa var. corymbosa]|uniref:OLC1v1007677C1 n=1 Tax=Oldenlandia corymbosa var. corymbosa TaxID=529605 RepID=A0AAV1DJT0_OLDCO|nr:OLC1v1007677C1 [Oldenlandia corymbosa var. corymbosa]
MRGRSYTPSPPRGYGRRGRSPSPRGRYGGRARDAPTSLLVRNLRHDCRPEDLRRPFGQFGPVKDIYLPRDYYTGEPRGFGFVQYVEPADAGEAKYQMDGQMFQGRQLTVVFAEENRKKPVEMRARERGTRSRHYDRRRSPPRYSRSPQYSRSPPHRYGKSRSRSRDYYSPPPKRRYSRSVSPQERRYSRERTYSRSPVRERSPPFEGSRSRSRSPGREISPPYNGPRSRSRSPKNNQSPPRAQSRSPSRSRSRSPGRGDYRGNPERDGSPYH